MVAKRFYDSKKYLSFRQQDFLLRREYPSFNLVELPRSEVYIKWIGKIKPNVFSREYEIEITCKKNSIIPIVKILSPKLINKYGKIPHIYNNTKGLCLFYPYDEKDKVWTPQKPITLIIPWISKWITFYEIFAITGKWYGGGVEHDGKKNC